MTRPAPGIRLRELLADGRLVVAPGVFDGISAHLVKRMGFACGYLTGGGVAASGFGVPDLGLVTATEMADRAALFAEVLGEVPLIADADTGYGGPINVARTIRAYERAGVAAIQLEDQAFPKRCGHLPDKELVSESEFVAKLGAALDVREDSLIIARTDARGVLGLEAAIDRVNTYAAAGADVVFVEAPQSNQEIAEIAKNVTAPLLINLVQGGRTPIRGAEYLQDLGYAIAIHPATPLLAVANTMVDAYAELGGTRPEVTASEVTGFFDLLGLEEWFAVGEKWGKS
ncbi:isocitrate lyase/PEP mutase family protein [Amycolatopsis jiangsuensis]|uniref:2-methylisocitrate lyase-like PEP mutase family enzyme n=1 Tax=Amycolatopsis jiangsuensis TaxID=1181879 RepID=A0A840J7S0_9PSEU|nr:isocitrate lyase/phosphoenolpyruvate mutase family protein [Amycolatopsis jiangsuensis]MBB4689655.1 2-methylisocitrate lyase-like PEP mutase family enzyme [Amycolatopsis jiangsuensis]